MLKLKKNFYILDIYTEIIRDVYIICRCYFKIIWRGEMVGVLMKQDWQLSRPLMRMRS